MTKEEFVDYLLKTLNYAYCDNCGTEDRYCNECARKYQNWSLSRGVAEEIADHAVTIPSFEYGLKFICENGNEIWYEPVTDITDGWVERTSDGAIIKTSAE